MYFNYSICSLTHLEVLDLSENNKLTTLPDRIGDMKSLRKLDVSKCNITQLPDRLVIYCCLLQQVGLLLLTTQHDSFQIHYSFVICFLI
mgnify:CR=1 FL=1